MTYFYICVGCVCNLLVSFFLWWNLTQYNSGFTEAWRHHGDDLWWSLCHLDDVTFLNLHRIDL